MVLAPELFAPGGSRRPKSPGENEPFALFCLKTKSCPGVAVKLEVPSNGLHSMSGCTLHATLVFPAAADALVWALEGAPRPSSAAVNGMKSGLRWRVTVVTLMN